jgi:hypothetical protein
MSSRLSWGPLALPLAGVLASLGCGEGKAKLTPQEVVMRREVEGLRPLVAAAENGTLLDFAQMLVVVDQGRIDSARASFGDGLALVHLVGEARIVGRPVSAPVDVYGGLDSVDLDPGTGILRARVNLYTVDLSADRALGGAGAARRLAQALASGGLDALLGPIEVPIRIEDRLRLPALRTPRVRIPGMDVPVEAVVSSLKVFGGKLWVGVSAHVAGAPDGASPHGVTP